MTDSRQDILKEFRQIPGVGPSISLDLYELGFRQLSDLKGQDPEEMFERFCHIKSTKLDRCLLYVFRCAVYYASHEIHDPELLKWWNWKDKL